MDEVNIGTELLKLGAESILAVCNVQESTWCSIEEAVLLSDSEQIFFHA